MNTLLATMSANRTSVILWSILGAAGLAFAVLMFSFLGDDGQEGESVRALRIEVKRAVSGHSVTLESDERLNYAGIRTLYKHESELLYEEARKRNGELVDGQKVRVRYDVPYRDRKGRLLGYVSVDGQLVNETLVREGLAYARLTTETRRFADLLLAAQADARKHRRGIWRHMSKSSEASYPADPKYGNFHHPSCAEVEKIKPDRLVTFGNKGQAFEKGFAPCSKCLP